jgi:Uma2 family endonuclease
MVMSTRVVLTYRDYAALPDDRRRYEVHEGELSVTPAPGTRHQEVVGNLYAVLREHVLAHDPGKVYLAPIDVILTDTSIVQPDLVFVATERSRAISSRGIEGAPTLAVEIVSPSTISIDRHTKFQLYARYGVPYYWIVDVDPRMAEGYILEAGQYRLAARATGDESFSAPPFTDLTISAAALWR